MPGDNVGDLVAELTYPSQVRSRHAILQRPSSGWSKLQRGEPRHRLRDFLRYCGVQTGANPFTRLYTCCDNDCLCEEIVRHLDVQRQIEADGAAADISGPSVDIRIAL